MHWRYLLILAIWSCGNRTGDPVCFPVSKGDFTETIRVQGTIQAENTTFLKSPPIPLSTITWIEQDGKYVRKGDTVCIFEHPETTEQLVTILRELEQLAAGLEKLEADNQLKLAMLQSEIENNNIELSIKSLDSIQKKFAPPLQQKLISLEQQKAAILREKLDKKLMAQERIGETEIKGMQSRIKQMENRVQRVRDELDQLIVIAPKDGLLVREELPKLFFMTGDGFGSLGGKIAEGSLTWATMNILEIPDMTKMQVLAELSENHYKRAEEGQKVLIEVDAKNHLATSGTLKKKMLTGNQQGDNSKVKMYEAIIEIDSCHEQLSPGMSAVCDIILKEFKDTIVVPAVAIFEEDEQDFVFVDEGNKFRKIPVVSTSINSSYAIIQGGVPSGTSLALSRPPSNRIIKKQ